MRTPPRTSVTYGLLESLGQAIVTGEYEGRAFPTEAELSERYRASRSVTREAVKMLTAKGLLSARPRHGTVIEPELVGHPAGEESTESLSAPELAPAMAWGEET